METANTSTHRVYESPTTTAAAWTTQVKFKKVAGRDWVYIRMNDNTAAARYCYFNITTLEVGAEDAGMTGHTPIALADGWVMVAATIATAAAGSNPAALGIADADNSNSYLGDITKGVYISDAQTELGSFPTSYIKTEASAATRNATSLTAPFAFNANDFSWNHQGQV